MQVDLEVVRSVATAGSFVVAAFALAVTARNSRIDRRNRELDSLLSMWRRYEEYGGAEERVKVEFTSSGDPTEESVRQYKFAFYNTANFIENLCLVYNRNTTSRLVRDNIKHLVLDFLTLVNRRLSHTGVSYYQILSRRILDNETYAEIRKFSTKHKEELKDRAARAENMED